MRIAARGVALHTSSAVCWSASAPRTTIAASTADASGPRNRSSRPGIQRQTQGERSLSGSTAPKAAATAMALDSMAVNEDDWAGIPAHRALQVFSRYRALVLDSAYRPIDVVNWQRAICMDLLEKADVLEYYEMTVSSVSEQFFLPAVMRARWYGNSATGRFGRVSLNRRNILLRDKLACMYCGKAGKERDGGLTLDHVIPQSKGGKNTWENLVTCCPACNCKKGNKTLKELKWRLREVPREPSPYELNLVLSAIGGDKDSVPTEWANYLFGQRSGGL